MSIYLSTHPTSFSQPAYPVEAQSPDIQADANASKYDALDAQIAPLKAQVEQMQRLLRLAPPDLVIAMPESTNAAFQKLATDAEALGILFPYSDAYVSLSDTNLSVLTIHLSMLQANIAIARHKEASENRYSNPD